MLDQAEKSLNNQLEKAMAKWGSDNLVGIWFILHTPQWGEDGPYLDQNDIMTLKQYVLELKNELAVKGRKDE